MTETEIKLRWEGTAEQARELIERHGYEASTPRTLEADQLFDLVSGDLRQSDQIVRLRRTSSPGGITRAVVTYKGPAIREVYKSREEIEFEVSDPDAFTLVLDRLGYHPGFRYEKFRTMFSAPATPGVVTIDETPIGIFLELEGPEAWIDSTAGRLGFPATHFLTVSYAALYRGYRERHADAGADMTFDPRGPYSPQQNGLRRPQKH